MSTKVASVMFLANINIDGRAGNNLEATRDGVGLSWHEQTGGVIVEQGGKEHYVSPQSIMSVTFADRVASDPAASSPQSDVVMQAERDAVSNNATLADQVLGEFQEDKEAMPQPKPKRDAKHK